MDGSECRKAQKVAEQLTVSVEGLVANSWKAVAATSGEVSAVERCMATQGRGEKVKL